MPGQLAIYSIAVSRRRGTSCQIDGEVPPTLAAFEPIDGTVTTNVPASRISLGNEGKPAHAGFFVALPWNLLTARLF